MSRDKTPPRAGALRFLLVWTPVIRATLRDVGVPIGDVDDACQEVLILAWKAAESGHLATSYPPAVRAWVRLVAGRIGLRWAWRRKRVLPSEHVDVAERDDDAEAPHLARDLLQELQGETTPERWRVWVMREQGYSLAEIAAAERVPAGTVHTRLKLCRRDFQAALVREKARASTPVRRKGR